MSTLSGFVKTRACNLQEVSLVGFQGQSLEEERELFRRLQGRLHEIPAKTSENPYLVVSGKYPAPFVAVEVSGLAAIPEGMSALTIPEGEYVAFAFKKEHVGDFWANVCTDENQANYRIDLSKPRFEISTPDLHDSGLIEWYIPTQIRRG